MSGGYLPYGNNRGGGMALAGLASILVHVALIVGFIALMRERFDTTEVPRRNEFTITLERMDTDTLAGLVERQGQVGAAPGEDTDQDTGDTAEQSAPESPAPQEPDQPAAPGPAEGKEVAEPPEVAEPVVPADPGAVDPVAEGPEALLPEEVDPGLEAETVEALAPEEGTAPQQPETVQRLTPDSLPTAEAPDAGQLAALEPIVPLEPVTPDSPLVPETVVSSGAVQSVAPVGSGGEPAAQTIVPVGPEGVPPRTIGAVSSASRVVGALRPEPPSTGPASSVPSVSRTPPTEAAPAGAPRPAAPQSAQDLAIGDLIRRIRGNVSDPCLLALPRRDGETGVGLAMMASEDGAMQRFSREVLTSEQDADIRQTRTLVDPRQCPALTYVRQSDDYPATRIGLALDAAEVPSGGNLTGILRGVSGRYVLLLLVDNNGVVQDLQRFMTFSGNFARFDVPVTRVGSPRDTSQLLLAIATRRPAGQIRDRAGQLAQDVFAGIGGEAETGAALAIATFDVR